MFLRCLGCGRDRRADLSLCPGCGTSQSALVVVGWSVEEARRADRISEWKRAISALSWATKAGFLAAFVVAAMAAGSIARGFQCAVMVLGVIAFAALSKAWHHARRPRFEDHARGDASWMFAGPWLFAMSESPSAALREADDDASDMMEAALGDLVDGLRIPLASITSVERRPGGLPGFQRLVLRLERAGTADRCRLEFALDEATARGILESIRAWLRHDDPNDEWESWRTFAVPPRSDPRLQRFSPDALIFPCRPSPDLDRSMARTDRATAAVWAGFVYGILSSIPVGVLAGVASGSGLVMGSAAFATLVVWLGFSIRCARRARARWKRGGAQYLVVDGDGIGLAQDMPEKPIARHPVRAIAVPSGGYGRPDRRVTGGITLLSLATPPVEITPPPVQFEPMDAPTLWSIADEITRRLER